jgi:hypothetical protein
MSEIAAIVDEPDCQLLGSLARGHTVADSAKLTGISERTIYRRLGQMDFRRRLAAKRGEILASALGALTDAAREATGTLRLLMQSQNQFVALSASRTIVELILKLRSEVDMDERLRALEDDAAKERGEVDDEA